MELARAPALLSAIAFALGLCFARAAAWPPPVGALAILAALGLALGRSAGRGLAAGALGALTLLAAPQPLHPDPALVAGIRGRTGPPRDGERGAAAVPLRAESLSQGGEISPGRLDLWLDLPAGSPPPAPGSRIRVRGTVGRSPGFANRRVIGPGPWRLRVKVRSFLDTERAPPAWLRVLWRLRSGARRLFEQGEGTGRERREGLRVARALLLGEATALEPGWRRALRRTGLGHLVAVSGLHVSLVALFVSLLSAPAGRSGRRALVAAAVLGYLALVGASASALRASIMSLLALAGLASGRVPEALQGLAWALVALLLDDPSRIAHTGFLLSFAATAGILALAPRWAGRWKRSRLPRPLVLGFAATLAAQTASIPISVDAFGELSPAAPLFNLVAAPWAALVLVGGLLWLAAAAAWPALGAALAPLLDPLAAPLRALDSLPPSPWISLGWPGGWIAGLWIALLLFAAGEGGRSRRAACLGALALLQVGHGASPEPPFQCLIFDVGQGDGALLRRGRTAFLVDGGGSAGIPVGLRVLRPALAEAGIATLAAMIVTHADLDHCGGLLEVAREIRTEELWAPVGAADAPCVRDLAETTGRPVRTLVAGDRLLRSGFRFEVLHPGLGHAEGPDNASSLVLAIVAGGRRLLFTADIGAAEERELVLGRRRELRADLLKVPHHGSAGSSSTPFLIAVRPRLAAVSAGLRNAYGHPSRVVMARLRRLGVPVVRTDRDGGLELSWRPGEPWRIELPASPRLRR